MSSVRRKAFNYCVNRIRKSVSSFLHIIIIVVCGDTSITCTVLHRIQSYGRYNICVFEELLSRWTLRCYSFLTRINNSSLTIICGIFDFNRHIILCTPLQSTQLNNAVPLGRIIIIIYRNTFVRLWNNNNNCHISLNFAWIKRLLLYTQCLPRQHNT